MRTFNFKRWTAAVITVLMLIGVIPFSTFAASAEFTNSQLSVAIDKESTLAPGVTLNDYTVYDKNGDQVRMFVTKADMSVDTVKLFASYKNMDPTVYGMSKLTEQVAAFNNKAAAGDPYYQGTVVAGINSSYYNMTTGKPTGTFVMNGIDVTNEAEGNSRSFFAVLNDGSVMIGGKGEYSSYKGQIKEAIGGYFHIVKDGQVYEDGYWSKTNPQKYPRQTIGITAEGDVILMMADGNQAPKSIGLTLLEQAQVMVDLGCVEALHLDGGGSGTYACKPEGQDDFVITNSPSDGSERSISNGFIIVSTAVASYTFDHVAYEVENDYMTPGTSVNVAVSGVSSTGNAADVPADITYVVDNGTYADGVFTAGDAVGDATITAMYNGQAVGSVTLNVVLPDAIAFSSAEMTVPYGKTVALGIDATYGVKEVAIKASDFTFALSNSAVGTIDGFNFTACAEDPAVTESDISAVLNGTELTANAKIILGKGSEVVYDFEDGTSVVVFDETPGTKYNYVWPETTQEIVDATTGEVHSGNYALSGVVDYSNSLESGYMKTSMYSTEQRVFKNAKKVGIWIYIDDEFDGLWARWTLQSVTFDANGNPVFGSSINSNNMDNTVGGTGVVSSFTEPGWHYLWADVSAYEAVGWKANSAMMQFYLSDRDGSAFNYVSRENRNIPATYQFYFDDITVDYSSAVDDREAPIFGGVTYAVEGMPDAAALNNQTVNTGKVTFAAKLADNTTLTNATGINADSVKAYIDGIETKCTYTGGVVTADVTGLDNGKHQVKFAAEDKMGNYASAFGYITVAADDSGSTVKLVPHDADLTYPKLGSIYWMDLVATDIQTVKSVEATIDLDNNSTWQLDHMTVATGFEASYTVDERFNVATVTVTKTGDVDATGEAALVSMPVRVWTLKEGYVYPNGTKAGAQAYTLRQFTTSLNEYWGMAVIADIDRGVLVRVDDTIDSFSGDGVKCDTEMWFCGTHKGNVAGAADYYNSWDKGHYHTAEAVADVAATCTTAGYTGRTFCAACNSVVDWGTTIAAAGHDYAVTDGVLKCECGEVFNGVYTDGKTYVDGVMLSGWVDGKYYADGVALTGIAAVDGVYYNFGDDGVSKGKYTGLVEIDGKYYYAKLGTLTAGWFDIDGAWYYFLPETLEAAEGSVTADNGITFDFVDGKVQSVVWEDWYSFKRCWYGPSYYYNTSKNVKYLMVEIDGDIYFFNSAGCMQKGVVVSHESNRFEYFAYDCGTDGKGQLYTGVAEDMYFENGWQVRELRLAYANGEYVFVKNTNKVADTCTVDLVGELTGLVFADGEVYYVENGYPVAKGLVQASDGNYYLITSTLKAVKNCWYGMNETHLNGYSLATGIYWFYEDGRMQVKEGIYREKNGNICYYENGYPVAKGLVQDTDGSYYLFTSSKKAVVNSWYGMNETHL
ncbi:MAG: phosphodiester glycosidase family protein, partial [Clostridia bacterium]|nr:phosphodiester glycosidase family protein [Clostridia bacterium]